MTTVRIPLVWPPASEDPVGIHQRHSCLANQIQLRKLAIKGDTVLHQVCKLGINFLNWKQVSAKESTHLSGAIWMAGVAPRITLDFGHLPCLTSANSKILHQHIMVPMQWLIILHCFCSFEVTPVYAMSKITFEMCQANLEHWSSSRTLLRYGKWFDKTGLSNSSLSVTIFKTTPFYLKQAAYKTKGGNVSGSLSPLQWSYHIHSSWKQQLHVNYLTTIYLQLASYTWEKAQLTQVASCASTCHYN